MSSSSGPSNAFCSEARADLTAASAALTDAPWVDTVDPAGDRDLRIRVRSLDLAEHHLVPLLAHSGAVVIAIEPESPTLEDVFLELTR